MNKNKLKSQFEVILIKDQNIQYALFYLNSYIHIERFLWSKTQNVGTEKHKTQTAS